MFINPFLTQHKPKVLMKQSEGYLQVFSSFFFSFFLFLFFSPSFSLLPFSLLPFSSPFSSQKGMKASQSMIWIYGFFWPEGIWFIFTLGTSLDSGRGGIVLSDDSRGSRLDVSLRVKSAQHRVSSDILRFLTIHAAPTCPYSCPGALGCHFCCRSSSFSIPIFMPCT